MDDLNKQAKETQNSINDLTASMDKLSQKLNDLTKQGNNIGTIDKAFAGVKNKIDNVSNATNFFGKVLGDSAKGFKPMVDNLKTAETVTSKFKESVNKAGMAYKTYSDGLASGKSKFDALKDVFPALSKGVEGGTTGMKTFKNALAETGIGLIVIAVAALIEKLQTVKPIMDMVNAATAALGAVMSTIGNGIIGIFTGDNVSNMKDFGAAMANAAKDAYNLSLAQEKLKASTSAQQVYNDKIRDEIELLHKRSADTNLSADVRIKALSDQQRKEEEYYRQNSSLAKQAIANGIEDLRLNKSFSKSIIDDLKKRGILAAAELLKQNKINQEQFDNIKKLNDDLRVLGKQRETDKEANTEAIQKINDDEVAKQREAREKVVVAHKKELDEMKAFTAEAEKTRADSVIRMSLNTLQGYEREIKEATIHYDGLTERYIKYQKEYLVAGKVYKKLHANEYKEVKAAIEQLEQEKNDVLAGITKNFHDNDLRQLTTYQNELTSIAAKEGKTAQQLAMQQLDEEYKIKLAATEKIINEHETRAANLASQTNGASKEKILALQKQIDDEKQIVANGLKTSEQLTEQYDKDKTSLNKTHTKEDLQTDIANSHDAGNWQREFALKQEQLNQEREQAIQAAGSREDAVAAVKARYNTMQQKLDNDRLDAQFKTQQNYLKGLSSLSNAVTSIFGKNTVAARVAFKAQQAAAAGQVIIDTQKSIMGIWSANSGIPFVGVPKAILETALVAAAGASSLASIIKQKPGFAAGGQFQSDGRGALLPGYSRTDNTNAYLRSGEAVVVSEAMRNPWARNLVSAINVAHGGRDFSIANPGLGYAIGGIFTDGGNANRYYSQPLNDQKDLANTLAYQMINNFPPIYVDVKDINTQQNILARTVDRVNL